MMYSTFLMLVFLITESSYSFQSAQVTPVHENKGDFLSELNQKAKSLKQKPFTSPQVLMDPQINQVIFPGQITPKGSDLKPTEIFFILRTNGLMKEIPETAENPPPEFGDIKTVTPYGTIERLPGGFFSAGIYSVNIYPDYAVQQENRHFIIKMIGWGGNKTPTKISSRLTPTPTKEVQDLQRVRQVMEDSFNKLESTNKAFPKIALHSASSFFIDSAGEKQYLTILPVVGNLSGKNFVDDTIDTGQDIGDVMHRIGRSLGEFHYNLATDNQKNTLARSKDFLNFITTTHGDFHLGNVFINEDSISFIDNASISDSLTTPKSPFLDIIRLYSMDFVIKKSMRDTRTYHNLKYSMNDFIHGYIKAYPESCQKNIADAIINIIREFDKIVINEANKLISISNQPMQKSSTLSKLGLDYFVMVTMTSLKKLLSNKFTHQGILENLSLDIQTPPLPKLTTNFSKIESFSAESDAVYATDDGFYSLQPDDNINPKQEKDNASSPNAGEYISNYIDSGIKD